VACALPFLGGACYMTGQGKSGFAAGWSSPVARQAHNLKVVGSNPTPATKFQRGPSFGDPFGFLRRIFAWSFSNRCPLFGIMLCVDLNLARGPASGIAASRDRMFKSYPRNQIPKGSQFSGPLLNFAVRPTVACAVFLVAGNQLASARADVARSTVSRFDAQDRRRLMPAHQGEILR
jgi:hypothetical protein